MDEAQQNSPFEGGARAPARAGDVGRDHANGAGVPVGQRGGVLVEIPPPVPGVPVGQRGGMLVRLLGKLLLNPINIPLRRFAFATRRCPPSKGGFC